MSNEQKPLVPSQETSDALKRAWAELEAEAGMPSIRR